MTPNELDVLIQKYLAGTSTKEEDILVEKVYSHAGKRHVELPVLNSQQLLALENRLHQNILGRTRKTKQIPQKQKKDIVWYYAAAASLLIMISVGYFVIFPQVNRSEKADAIPLFSQSFIRNNGKANQRIALSDGSFVSLYPQSTIRISLDSISDLRVVFLEGEAFFDVAPDKSKPFLVYTQNVVTRVLGTSFMVKAFETDKDIRVTVMEGKVSVTAQNIEKSIENTEVILTPNQEAVFNKSSQTILATLAEDPIIVGKALDNSMRFEEEHVSVILKQLETAYKVKIVFDEKQFERCRITSTFVEENLYDRLTIICSAIGCTYEIAGTEILVKNPKCFKN